MEEKTKSPKFLRQRKLMMVLPLLVLPFVILFFVMVSGGNEEASAKNQTHPGLIKSLPDAKLKQEVFDKLKYYENAATDSLKLKAQMKLDPYYEGAFSVPGSIGKNNSLNTSPYSGGAYNENREDQVYRKLEQLNAVLNNPEPEYAAPKPRTETKGGTSGQYINTQDVDRLQRMMQVMKSPEDDDPEMKQLHSMLDKIQEIQHPELLRTKNTIKKPETPKNIYSTIPAEVSKNQKITQGTVVELRLLDSVRLNGHLIPKGHKIYGSSEISNQRLNLEIKNIRIGLLIIPVDLTVFDMKDSMEGINVPEALTSDAIRGGSDNAMQGLNLMTMDQTVGTQLAGAGISAAKGLFSKKVRLLKGKVREGYPVLLRNNQNNNH